MSRKLDVEGLRDLAEDGWIIDKRPLIAKAMWFTGATYEQIGEVFGMSKQGAKSLVVKYTKKAELSPKKEAKDGN